MCFIFLKSKDDNKSNDTKNYYEEFAGEIISPIMLEEMEMDSEMIDNLDNK
jgi:hypothetical protein